jgi:hypothetical protein
MEDGIRRHAARSQHRGKDSRRRGLCRHGSARALRHSHLAAIAFHAETGDQLVEGFSTHYLDSSKTFAHIRPTVERILGRSVETLGIREGAAATFIGGHGRLRIGGHTTGLVALHPFVGFGREALMVNVEFELAAGGLFLVENLQCLVFAAGARLRAPIALWWYGPRVIPDAACGPRGARR